MSTSTNTDALAPGAEVGRWTLVERLGSGAFGTTWRALGPDGAEVAFKLLDRPPGEELRALASICHPSVVGVLGGGGTPPHVVMELARGRSLGALLARQKPLSEARTVRILAHLADGLAAVHAAGVVHGDLKPDNLVVHPDGSARIVDFGMAGTRGGTRAYASPERAQTGPTPEADIYAAGLVLWQLLHGRLPSASGTLGLRPTELRPVRGVQWLRDLLVRMLADAPAARPTSAEVADTVAAHGEPLPEPTPELLRRRARTVFVPRPHDEAVDRWLVVRGALLLQGSPGSGRSHTLERAVVELSARGLPWVMIRPALHPWAPIRSALADPGLGPPVELPPEPDPEQRAIAAAADLEDRAEGLVVLVDDLDLLDPGSRATVHALVRRGRVAVLATTEDAQAGWTGDVARVFPLDSDGLEQLTRGLLGGAASLGRLVETLELCTGGVAGTAVEFVLAAVRSGSVVRRAHRWLVDDAQLDELAANTLDTIPPEEELSEAAAAVGAVLGLAEGPVDPDMLPDLAGVGRELCTEALQELLTIGLAVVDAAGARARDAAAAAALAGNATDRAALHRGLEQWLRALDPVPWERVGWQIAGAGDTDAALRDGARCLEASTAVDPGDAARMAEALWLLAKSPELAVARVEALVSAGRAEEALSFGQAVLPRSPDPVWASVGITIARQHLRFSSDLVAAERSLDDLDGLRLVPTDHALMLMVRAQLELKRGDVDDAVRLATAGLDLSLEPELRYVLLGTLAQALERQSGPAAALACLDAAMPSMPRNHTTSWARLEQDRGFLCARSGQLHQAAEAFRAAAQVDGLPSAVRAGLLNNAAGCEYSSGHIRQALASWERAALLFERMDSIRELASVQGNLCLAYAEIGRWERALEAAEDGLARTTAPALATLRATILGNLGDVRLARDELDLAGAAWQEALELATEHNLTQELVELARRRAALAVVRRAPDAIAEATRAVSLADRHGMPFERSRSVALLALARVRGEEPANLAAMASEAVAPLLEAGAARDLAEVRLTLAEAYLESGHAPLARELAERVITYADEVGAAPLRMRADALCARTGRTEHERPIDRLLDLAVAVARERDLSTLLGTVADAALGLLEADRAFVLLAEGRGGIRIAAARTRDGVELGAPAMSIVRRALSGRREVIAGDLDERGDLEGAASVMELDLRSALCVPMVDRDELLGAIYVDSQAVTDQQWSEAARVMRALAAHAAIAVTNARHVALLEQRAALAAEMAHDLSSPAHVVLCIADEILEDTLEPREIARDLRGTGRLLLGMRERFLGSESRRSEAPLVELTEHLERLSTQLARVARGSGRILDLQVDEPTLVQCDPHELDRAVSNLVRNALRFSPPGGKVHLIQRRRGGSVRICVRDHGPGVPAGKLEAIFLRGVQAQADGQGHGLGLAIAQRVVLEHGGRLSVRNHPEGGAEFTIELPRIER